MNTIAELNFKFHVHNQKSEKSLARCFCFPSFELMTMAWSCKCASCNFFLVTRFNHFSTSAESLIHGESFGYLTEQLLNITLHILHIPKVLPVGNLRD